MNTGTANLLLSTEIALQKDRITTGTDWTFSTGVDRAFAQFKITYRLSFGARKRAYFRSVAELCPSAPDNPVERLKGDWERDSFVTFRWPRCICSRPKTSSRNQLLSRLTVL